MRPVASRGAQEPMPIDKAEQERLDAEFERLQTEAVRAREMREMRAHHA